MIVSWLAFAAPAGAQSFDLGLGLGFYADFPATFTERYCGGDAPASVTGSAAWRILPWLSLESGASLNGELGGRECYLADFAPPPIDVPFTVDSYDDGIVGTSYFESRLSAVVEPLPAWTVSPRARLGYGRIWDKDLTYWLFGGGLRFRFGRSSLVMDMEQWKARVYRHSTTVIYHATGGSEVLSSDTIEEDLFPVVVRVGWEISVGR